MKPMKWGFGVLILAHCIAFGSTCRYADANGLVSGSQYDTMTGDWKNHSKYVCLQNVKWGRHHSTSKPESMENYCLSLGDELLEITTPLDWQIIQTFLQSQEDNCKDNDELTNENCKILSGIRFIIHNVGGGKMSTQIKVNQKGAEAYLVWAKDNPQKRDSPSQTILLNLDKQYDPVTNTESRMMTAQNFPDTLHVKNAAGALKVQSLPCCQFKAVSQGNCHVSSFEALQNKKVDSDFTYIGTSFNYTWMLSRFPLSVTSGQEKCETHNGKSTGYTYYMGEDRVGGIVLGKEPITRLNEDKYLYRYLRAEFLKRNIYMFTSISCGIQTYGRLGEYNERFSYFNWHTFTRPYDAAPRAFALCYRKFTPNCKH